MVPHERDRFGSTRKRSLCALAPVHDDELLDWWLRSRLLSGGTFATRLHAHTAHCLDAVEAVEGAECKSFQELSQDTTI